MWRLTTGNALKRAATLTPEELGLPDWLDVFPSDGALEPQVRQPLGHLQSWPANWVCMNWSDMVLAGAPLGVAFLYLELWDYLRSAPLSSYLTGLDST